MKKIVYCWCALLLLCLVGKPMAQSTLFGGIKTDQNRLEQRQMEAFAGQTTNIPYQSATDLSALTNPAQKLDFAVKMRPLSENAALQTALKENKRKKSREKASVEELTVDTVLTTDYWAVLASAEDGSVQLVTMEFESPSASSWYYRGVTYTLFDENLKPGKSFSIKTPARTQDISIMEKYSTRFFNTDNKKEFMVSVHSFVDDESIQGPESCRDTLFIINEDGEVLRRFGNMRGALLQNINKDGSIEKRVQLVDAFYSDLADTITTSVYKAADIMENNPKPLFTFHIPENLTTYCNGSLAFLTEIDGQQRYITSQYRKPFVKDNDHEAEDLNVEMDNLFDVFIYDVDFNLVRKISLPLFGLEENKFSFSTLMYFGKYMITRKVFNQDDKYEIIYGMDRYDLSCDCNKLQLYLVNEDGEILKEIAEDVANIVELQAIMGENDEYALCLGSEEAVTGILMMDLPSLKTNFYFPALYKNELLSMYFDRVPAAEGGYNYIFGLGRGESADNTTYGGIVYYDRQGNKVKHHRIDLGADCLLFTPIINSTTLNPYAFVADEKQEYLYFYRFSKNDAAGRGFGIANEDETLYLWQDNATDGEFSTAGVLTDANATEMKYLYLSWQTPAYTMKHVFYPLPLKEIELKGDGTQASPYVITTPAELDMVRRYSDKWFVLGNDIDMAAFTGVNGSGFVSIREFSGHFDGKGYFIKNIIINGNGIFSSLNGAEISNLSVRHAVFAASSPMMSIGVIAGSMGVSSSIKNCHVESDVEVRGDYVGGLVGQATNFSTIDRCSFTGSVSGTDYVGGIAGDLRTSGTVSNSYVRGSVSGISNVGGIAGYLLNGGTVTNSYSTASIYASATIAGGVVGSNNGGQVSRVYSDGKVEVGNAGNNFERGVAGGVAGYTVPNAFAGQIKYSFALNDTVVAPKDAFRVANHEYYISSDSVKALDSNFALASMLVGASNELKTVSDAECAKDRQNGESGTLESFDKAFYQNYGWNFGTTDNAPWQMTGNKPYLWWENVVRGVTMASREVSVEKGKTVQLVANVIPQEATDKTLLWSSEEPQTASVDAQGVVTGRSAGKTVITAKTPDGQYSASCIVNVEIPVESVTFNQKEITIPLEITTPLTVTVLPEDATNKSVIFQSLDPDIAITGGPAVYGLQVGTARVIAVSEDGNASDTCLVHVEVPITGILLNVSELTMDKQTPTFQLVATVYPAEAAGSTVVWKSTDARVASVDNTGLVSAHEKGEAMITASSADGSVSAPCFVTVTEFVSASNEKGVQTLISAYAANGKIVVRATGGMEWVKVYNVSGQCVASGVSPAAETITVDAASLPQGVYLLQVGLSSGQTAGVKVIK